MGPLELVPPPSRIKAPPYPKFELQVPQAFILGFTVCLYLHVSTFVHIHKRSLYDSIPVGSLLDLKTHGP